MAILVIMTGCSSGSTEQNSEGKAAVQVFAIGDTVKTDQVEFTLNEVKIANKVGLDADNWLEPTNSGGCLAAGDGNVFVWLKFRVKNLSKDDMNGESTFDIRIDYNNGYTYDDGTYTWGYNWSTNPSISKNVGLPILKPLDEGDYYGYIKCADEIRDNREAPLQIILSLPSEEGTKEYAYDYSVDDTASTGEAVLALSNTLNHLAGNMDFVSKYAGNANNDGSVKFADSFIEELDEDIAAIEGFEPDDGLESAVDKIASVKENAQKVRDLLVDMGEANSTQNVDLIKSTALETLDQINSILSNELSAYN